MESTDRDRPGAQKSKSKGLILVKDENDKIFMVDKNDKRYKNGELKCFWFGRNHTEESKRKIGEKNAINQKGYKNSQYGTCWIMSEMNKECKKINKSDIDTFIEKVGKKEGK